MESHRVVVMVNTSSFCTSIQLEHHRGPCHCQCITNSSSCHARQQFLPGSCSCQCSPSLASKKSVCSKSSVHRWDSESCQCMCEHSQSCPPGHHLNTHTCQCQDQDTPPPPQCSYSQGVDLVQGLVLLLVVITTSTTMYCCSYMRKVLASSHRASYCEEEDMGVEGYTGSSY